jgi:Cu/Zn superoxide dismutase
LPRRSLLRLVSPVALVLSVAACSGVNFHFGSPRESEAPRGRATGYGEEASLRAIGGSSVFGKIRVIDRGDNASVLVSLMNMPPGPYRVAITETPNCSSPNGFSAGPPWAPAGRDPQTLIPEGYANAEIGVEVSLRVPGLRAEGPSGVAGRSVVVYTGSRITPARPDVPNERVACGVFEPAQPPSLSF